MNNQLIEKVIKTNNEKCPKLIYLNPVLDRNVACAISKSFVNILKVSGQSSNINNNLRHSVLENIRRLCQVEPENHLNVDENFTELITEVYQRNIEQSTSIKPDDTDRLLDAFLLRKLKCVDTNPIRKSPVNPEIVLALSHLDENHTHLQINDVIHWDNNNHKCLNVLKNMWYSMDIKNTTDPKLDDISIKMKSEIEMVLLDNCTNILKDKDIDLEVLFTPENSLLHLVKISSVSPECYQICYSILNYVFVHSNFDKQILNFISTFVNYVKIHSPNVSISNLYSSHLCNVVLLLDVNLEDFPDSTRKIYIEITVAHLKTLHTKCENDLILILSHFPDWFEIYFKQEEIQ